MEESRGRKREVGGRRSEGGKGSADPPATARHERAGYADGEAESENDREQRTEVGGRRLEIQNA